MEKIADHLKQDETLWQVLQQTGIRPLQQDSDLYLRLLRAIVGQQLSVKAASTIWERFLDHFPARCPLPEMVIDKPNEELRKCGLSFQKSGYVRNIASFALENSLDSKFIQKMNDEEIIAYLTSIKGVGKWTVEMLLMFALGRPDVFPVDDLGIRNAMARLYNLDAGNRNLKTRLVEISARWSPYRTYACMGLWNWKDSQL